MLRLSNMSKTESFKNTFELVLCGPSTTGPGTCLWFVYPATLHCRNYLFLCKQLLVGDCSGRGMEDPVHFLSQCWGSSWFVSVQALPMLPQYL